MNAKNLDALLRSHKECRQGSGQSTTGILLPVQFANKAFSGNTEHQRHAQTMQQAYPFKQSQIMTDGFAESDARIGD